MIEKQDKDSIKLFHDDIEPSLKNIQFPNDLTTDPNLTCDWAKEKTAKEKHLTPKKVKFNHYKHKNKANLRDLKAATGL